MEKQFYKVAEIALILQCTKHQVYNYLKDEIHPLQHYVVGRVKLIRVEDFEKWIEEGKVN